jgi:hypothetical protein
MFCCITFLFRGAKVAKYLDNKLALKTFGKFGADYQFIRNALAKKKDV